MKTYLKCVSPAFEITTHVSKAAYAIERPIEILTDYNCTSIYWQTSTLVSSRIYDMRLIIKRAIEEIPKCLNM